MFHCLRHEGTGGRTLLVDGFYSANKVLEQSPENFELLSRVPIKHEFIENLGTHQNHMIGIGPVLSVYPWNNEVYMIRYRNDQIVMKQPDTPYMVLFNSTYVVCFIAAVL